MSVDRFPSATSIDYAFIGGLNFAVAMVVAPLVNLLSDRFRSRPPMLVGALLLGGGFISASFASRIWELYLSQGALVGAGVGFLYLPSIAIIPQWFEKRRSLASAVSAAGSGLGGLIFSLSTPVMIRNISLAWALRITGIITMTVNLCAVLLIRDRDHVIRPEYSGFDFKLLRRLDVILLLTWEFIMLFGYITILFSLSDFARSIGASSFDAGLVTALLSVGIGCGRPFVGFLSDKFGTVQVSAVFTMVTGIFCFAIWIPATSLGVAELFAILSGTMFGVFWAVSKTQRRFSPSDSS